ncbi:MAG: hypothetical protein IIZ69_13755, partial [Pseudomonas sp.]|nr:hypothetical protein [Pseudomonas sp.]
DTNMEYIAAANPAAVILLLNSEAQARCEAGHAIQQKDAAYAECKALRSERDAALAELESLRIQVGTLTEWYSNALDVIAEVTAAILDVTYMDFPDGGDVSIPEQILRMAKDAERYRQLRDGSGWPAVFDNSDDPEPLRGNDLDAAMAKESR